jgi:hypothetical protein
MAKIIGKLSQELTQEPFVVIGLKSFLPTYKIAIAINKKLNFDFICTNYFLSYKKKNSKEFPFYWLQYFNEREGLYYFLLSNISTEKIEKKTGKKNGTKSVDVLLIDNTKSIGSVLLIIGRDCTDKVEYIREKINEVSLPSVILCNTNIKQNKYSMDVFDDTFNDNKEDKKDPIALLRDDIDANVNYFNDSFDKKTE